jgi:hypothetical protein
LADVPGRRGSGAQGLARIRGGQVVEQEPQTLRQGLGGHAAALGDLRDPQLRPALVLGIGLAVIRQATGIVIATFYAPIICVGPAALRPARVSSRRSRSA